MLVVFQAIGLYQIFNRFSFEGLLDKVLLDVGKVSFGIYVCHMFFVNVFYKLLKINPFEGSYGLLGIGLILFNFLLSYVTAKIMKRTPFLCRII